MEQKNQTPQNIASPVSGLLTQDAGAGTPKPDAAPVTDKLVTKDNPPGFAVMPMELAHDRRLKARHYAVLMALYGHYNRKTKGPVFPSRKRMRHLTGYDESTISAVTRELVNFGWITKSGKGGFSRATRYTLNIIPGAKTAVASVTTGSSRQCDETPSSALSRQDPLATVAIRKEQSIGTEEKNVKYEKASARERLARALVDYFISSFRGLGIGAALEDTASAQKVWEKDILTLVDDGATNREIKAMISWLVEVNRCRTERRFRVLNPTQLREKWPKLIESASQDRPCDFTNYIDEPPVETRIRRQKAYADDLVLRVPPEGDEHDDDIAMARLLDPRNQVPAHIAFCWCVDRGEVFGLHLEHAFIQALNNDKHLLPIYKKIFPNLNSDRTKELRSIADKPADDNQALEEQDPESLEPANRSSEVSSVESGDTAPPGAGQRMDL